ncbi:MAG TPA: hypothetical protein VK988_22010, partial [Acidimicrobiales bacterium]|nr:hypothetical protein [Acidimicrobiales bacterium]
PSGGRLVRQPRRLPESLRPDEVAAFLSDLCTHRDRAMALATLLGALRAAEVRSCGWPTSTRPAPCAGGGQGQQGAHRAHRQGFFTELATTCAPSARRVVPTRNASSGCAAHPGKTVDRGGDAAHLPHPPGQLRVQPGTSSSPAAYLWDRARHRRLDLLVLRELVGHPAGDAAAYVHLSPDTLAAEFGKARPAIRCATVLARLEATGALTLLVNYARFWPPFR